MARSRSLPTDLFDDPDFFDLSSSTQVILLRLVLFADDYGRGLAHSGLLARKCNKEQALIEQALSELQAAGLVQCYAGERYSYYVLTRWSQWETLSRPAASKYPAPPSSPTPEISKAPRAAVAIDPSSRSSTVPLADPERLEEEAEREQEEERGKEEEAQPRGVDAASSSALPSLSGLPSSPGSPQALPGVACDQRPVTLSEQVAQILRLPQTEALSRLVTEYQDCPGLSLLGEADAARDYIDSPQRNRRSQSMSLTFFRRWLQREQQGRLQPPTPRASRPEPGGACQPQEAQKSAAGTLAAQTSGPEVSVYQAFVQRREQELRQLLALTTEEQRPAALKAYLLTGKLPERGAYATHA
jgi:hypothetical protein